MKTADSMFDHFKIEISQKQAALDIQAKTFMPLNGALTICDCKAVLKIPYSGSSTNPIINKMLLFDSPDNVSAMLNRTELTNFLSFVQDYTTTNYREVKNDHRWKALHAVQSLSFGLFDKKADLLSQRFEDATFCRKCGLILPLRTLTIDHAKPQNKGEDEAMVRTFRALGLTQETGYGRKNRFLQSKFAAGVGGQTTQQPKKLSNNARYTLNTKGIIYFTLLYHFGELENMRKLSMHHFVNLRPM